MHVLQHFTCLEVFQVAILIACATDLGDASHVDLCVRIANLVQDATQDPRITPPLALSRHALVPELHAGFQLSCPASQPRSSVNVDALATAAAVLVAASGAATSRTLSEVPTACTGGAAAASAPARRHSETIAAGVSCCSTNPKSSCAAAATARQASNKSPLGALPARIWYNSEKCGTSGKAGSRVACPASLRRPMVNRLCAPDAAITLN